MVSTVSGICVRIWREICSRSSYVSARCWSVWRRKTTSDTPITSAASRCSASRIAASFADVISGSELPLSPFVQTTSTILRPCDAHFTIVAPAPDSASSGCGVTTNTGVLLRAVLSDSSGLGYGVASVCGPRFS